MSFLISHDNDGNYVIGLELVFAPSEPQFGFFEDFVNRVESLDVKRITLDFTNCKYMDTRAISLIMNMYRMTKEKEVGIQVVGADEEIKDLLYSIKLDEILLIK